LARSLKQRCHQFPRPRAEPCTVHQRKRRHAARVRAIRSANGETRTEGRCAELTI
jgi:hypothetical protein